MIANEGAATQLSDHEKDDKGRNELLPGATPELRPALGKITDL
jgi:hypothetical protein